MSEFPIHFYDDRHFVELKPYQFSMSEHASACTVGPFLREHYVLLYVLKGSGTIKLGGIRYPFETGNVCVIFPQVVSLLESDGELMYLSLELDGRDVGRMLARAGVDTRHPVLSLSVPPEQSTLRTEFFALTDHREKGDLYQIAHVYLVMDALIAESTRQAQARIGNLQRYYVDTAIRFISKRYTEDITVEDIAQHCGLNRSYLGKLFREEVGVTTQEFLIQYRMRIACLYLKNTDVSIGTIAASVGYANQLHFSRAFRKVYGMSPRDWQKQHQQSIGARTAQQENQPDSGPIQPLQTAPEAFALRSRQQPSQPSLHRDANTPD